MCPPLPKGPINVIDNVPNAERSNDEPGSDVRSSGSVLLFIRLLGRREQSTEREVLRPICGRASDPGIGRPVAHPAHDDSDVTLAGRRPKLVGPALRTPIRRVHNVRVRRDRPRSEDLAADRSHARLGCKPGHPGLLHPGGVAEWFRQGPAKPRTPVRFRSPPPRRPQRRKQKAPS